jgi:hypothetical protein
MLIGTVRPEYPLVTPRRGLFIHAPGPAQMVKVPARNMDGTSPRSKCAEGVNAQVSGPDGREGGPSVKPSA